MKHLFIRHHTISMQSLAYFILLIFINFYFCFVEQDLILSRLT